MEKWLEKWIERGREGRKDGEKEGWREVWVWLHNTFSPLWWVSVIRRRCRERDIEV